MSVAAMVLASSLTASMLFGVGGAAADDLSNDPDPLEVVASSAEYLVRQWKEFPRKDCPDHRPYLTGHEYHPGSGWGIPRGVEIRSAHRVASATISATLRESTKWLSPSGIFYTRIGNYTTASTITVVMHCTRTPS